MGNSISQNYLEASQHEFFEFISKGDLIKAKQFYETFDQQLQLLTFKNIKHYNCLQFVILTKASFLGQYNFIPFLINEFRKYQLDINGSNEKGHTALYLGSFYQHARKDSLESMLI